MFALPYSLVSEIDVADAPILEHVAARQIADQYLELAI